MAIPMFAHEEKKAQKRQITGWIPRLTARGDSNQAAWLSGSSPCPRSILTFICSFPWTVCGVTSMYLAWLGRLAGWLAIFISFTWEGLSPQLKRIWKDLWLFWSCDMGRGSGFLFFKHTISWWKTLFSFCAYDAAKLSPGFISKWKEAAKIAILML